MRDKVTTLIGFAVKARKVVFGADNIERNRKVSLIICCSTLAERSLGRMILTAGGKIPVIISQNPLEDIVCKKGVKAAGITDKQMAKAIIQNLSDGFSLAPEDAASRAAQMAEEPDNV